MTDFPNLYETVNKIYSESSPVSRLLFVAKLREAGKESHTTPSINIFTSELKTIGRRIEGFNFSIINLGNANTIVLLEVILLNLE
jgi:hypothetical protein